MNCGIFFRIILEENSYQFKFGGYTMGKGLDGKELGKGIVQKKNGRYEARFTNRFGKRVSFSGNDLKKVRKSYNEAIYEDEKEINIKDHIRLDTWYQEWMNVYKYDTIRENTKQYYNYVYSKHISPTLGNFQLSKITQLDIKKLLKSLDKNGYGYETRNKVRILLVDIFNKALINEYVRKNPAKGIALKRNEEVERRVLSEEEQAIFFDYSKGTFYDNFFVTAIMTGMRIGEIAALRWKDIDWDKRVIHIRRTLIYQKFEGDTKKEFHFGDPKTNTSVRDIPINKQCEVALKRQYMQKSIVSGKAPITKKVDPEFSDLLFTTRYNTPINSQIISDAIKRIVTEINYMRDYLDEIETFSAHCFRHTFATRCFEAGIMPKTVQAYLGHATLQMTMDLYTSVMPKYMASEMEKVEDVFDKISDMSEDLMQRQFEKQYNSNIVPIRGDSLVV